MADTKDIKEQKKEYVTELKAMNRKQMKELRKANLDPSFVKMDNEKTAELVDWILDNSNFAHPKQACSNAWQGNVTY